ncbi:hypothetical protein DFH08DRAFT_817305 [Mycena albidolilacea]|uniref:Uncharacterized protein n=1 Tax=Mycena albidolilacea TaxID=1033008 RepID=A0AAD7EH15_9AGAR|nr:hypothetical protein DFH08DRAFT_817305 [Mycena albidolilacea]
MKSPTAVRLPILLLGSLALISALPVPAPLPAPAAAPAPIPAPTGIHMINYFALHASKQELKDVRPGPQFRRDEGVLESGSSFSTAPLDAAATRARATTYHNVGSNADSPPDDYYHIVEQFLY